MGGDRGREQNPLNRHLATEGLTKAYRGRVVVREVDIRIRPSEVVGLLGPNGAGKTTTFYGILGLVAPDQGRVLLDGEDITCLPMYLRARRGISYLPQEASIFRKMTVEDNLLAILESVGVPRPFSLRAPSKLTLSRTNNHGKLRKSQGRIHEIGR